MKTRVITVVLSMMAGTTLATAATAPFVERQVLGFDVRLVAAPPAGTTNYLVTERPPFGDVGNISHSGSYDPATRTVIFGPFSDGEARTLTYTDYSPCGSEGRFGVSGEAAANGAVSAIVGDDYVEIPPFPPLDIRLLLRWRPLSQQIAIQVMGGSGEPCFILASTNLQDWVYLGDLGSVFQGFELVDTEAPSQPCRFYRAQTIPLPQPLGTWDYQGYDAQGSLVVTGLLSFTSSVNPLAGTWDFRPVHTPHQSAHFVGLGTFTNAILSGSQVTVDLTTMIDNSFRLVGLIVGDQFTGQWHWDGEGPSESGSAAASRRR